MDFPRNLRISLRLVWQTLNNIKRLPHSLATECVLSTWSPLTTYTPSATMQLGFARVEANALAIGSLLILFVIFLFVSNDRSNLCGQTG
jgi:hypothetical protein